MMNVHAEVARSIRIAAEENYSIKGTALAVPLSFLVG
jgi:hypothetical protein